MTIQAQIDALPHSGGKIVIPPGIYKEPLRLSNRSGITLEGNGFAVFVGGGQLDYGLRIMNSRLIVVSGIAFTDWKRKAVHVTDSKRLTLVNCKFLHSVIEDGAHFSNCDHLTIDTCEAAECGRLHDGKGAHGIYLANGGSDAAIVGCTIHDMPAGAGIQINATEGTRLQSGTTIRGNTIRDVFGFGIQAAGMVDSRITGNTIERAGHGDTAVFLGSYDAGDKWRCRRNNLSGQSGKIQIEPGSS